MDHKVAFVDNISWYLESKALQNSLVILVATAILAAGAYYGYSIISQQRQEAAHALFATLYKHYTKAVTSGSTEELLHAATQFNDGYAQAQKSMLAPYFLAYSAHAYAQAGDSVNAQEKLTQALQTMPKSSPYYYLFATELAAINLDRADAAQKTEAVHALQSIVDARENIYSDMGLYYLIAYYSAIHDTNKVRELQKRINAFNSTNRQESSPWAHSAGTLA